MVAELLEAPEVAVQLISSGCRCVTNQFEGVASSVADKFLEDKRLVYYLQEQLWLSLLAPGVAEVYFTSLRGRFAPIF